MPEPMQDNQKKGRGRGKSKKTELPKEQVQQVQSSANGEKKSWEYNYNYEGMDQKMIDQRKRRIALKRMFEEMTLGNKPQAQQPVNIGVPQRVTVQNVQHIQ